MSRWGELPPEDRRPAEGHPITCNHGWLADDVPRLMASSYASSFRSTLYPGRRVPDLCGIVGEYGNTPMKGHIMLPVPNGSELEGTNLPASQQNKGWGIFSGTSAAAPQVAGVVALMLSVDPNLTPAAVKDILADTATDVTRGTTGLGDMATSGNDDATGAGFVSALAACQMTESLRIAGPDGPG